MGIRIHQLPPAIANQIAAGEVIERPASVVKELLENSLDAGATNIIVEISYGGLNQIKVSDNGSGIVADDLPLAVAAHATSKISKLDDLYAIDSMGFRGEALASIASIAKVTISSKPAHQEHAMMLRMEGPETIISPCARTAGTTIDVVDLFFNAPVRKKFLKGERLEFQAIELIIKRFALSAPNIAITLKHNNKQIITLPPALNEQAKRTRMARIFSSAFMQDAVYLNVELAGMSLNGWLSGPEYQRSQNDRQWVYINQRMVKDKLINHALKQAYDGLLHSGRFPACLLYFTINNAEVDVNVHPTKHEVRFQQPRLIHDFFTSQLSKALGTCSSNVYVRYDLPAIPDSEQVNDVREPAAHSHQWERNSVSHVSENNKYPLEAHSNASVGKNNLSSWSSEQETPWIVLNNQYILLFLKQQPYLVDVAALQQQRMSMVLKQTPLPLDSRPLLVPITYSLPHQLMPVINDLKSHLDQLGLHIELSNTDNLVIRSVPIKLPYLDLKTFFDSLIRVEELQLETLVELLCLSQVVDPRYFNREERIEINEMFFYSQDLIIKHQNVCKALTVDDCRMLFHV